VIIGQRRRQCEGGAVGAVAFCKGMGELGSGRLWQGAGREKPEPNGSPRSHRSQAPDGAGSPLRRRRGPASSLPQAPSAPLSPEAEAEAGSAVCSTGRVTPG